MLCIGCEREIPDEAAFCPLCGRPQKSGSPPQPVSRVESPEPAPERKAEKKAIPWLPIFFVCFGAYVWWGWDNLMKVFQRDSAPAGAPASNTEGSSDKAVAAAKTLVEKHLKAPSTAEWVSARVLSAIPPRYMVHVVVDAQNTFGAQIRSSFLVAVMLTGGDGFS